MQSRDFETPLGRRNGFSISQVCDWMKSSWGAVQMKIIIKSVKLYGISYALDGTEDVFKEASSNYSGDEFSSFNYEIKR